MKSFVPPARPEPKAIPKPKARIKSPTGGPLIFPPPIANEVNLKLPTQKWKVLNKTTIPKIPNTTRRPKPVRPKQTQYTRKPPKSLPPIILIRPRHRVKTTLPSVKYQPVTIPHVTTLPPIVVPPVQTALFEEAPLSPSLIDGGVRKVAILKESPSTDDEDTGQEQKTTTSTSTSTKKQTTHKSRSDIDPLPTVESTKDFTSTSKLLTTPGTTPVVPSTDLKTTTSIRTTTIIKPFVTFESMVTDSFDTKSLTTELTSESLASSTSSSNVYEATTNQSTNASVVYATETSIKNKTLEYTVGSTNGIRRTTTGFIREASTDPLPFISSTDYPSSTHIYHLTEPSKQDTVPSSTYTKGNVETSTSVPRQETISAMYEKTATPNAYVSSTINPKFTYLVHFNTPKKHTTTTSAPEITTLLLTEKQTNNAQTTTEKIHMNHSLKVMGIPLYLDMIGDHFKPTSQESRTIKGLFVHIPYTTQSFTSSTSSDVLKTTESPLSLRPENVVNIIGDEQSVKKTSTELNLTDMSTERTTAEMVTTEFLPENTTISTSEIDTTGYTESTSRTSITEFEATEPYTESTSTSTTEVDTTTTPSTSTSTATMTIPSLSTTIDTTSTPPTSTRTLTTTVMSYSISSVSNEEESTTPQPTTTTTALPVTDVQINMDTSFRPSVEEMSTRIINHKETFTESTTELPTEKYFTTTVGSNVDNITTNQANTTTELLHMYNKTTDMNTFTITTSNNTFDNETIAIETVTKENKSWNFTTTMKELTTESLNNSTFDVSTATEAPTANATERYTVPEQSTITLEPISSEKHTFTEKNLTSTTSPVVSSTLTVPTIMTSASAIPPSTTSERINYTTAESVKYPIRATQPQECVIV